MGATLIGLDPYRQVNLENTLYFVQGAPFPSNNRIALLEAQSLQAKIERDGQGNYVITHLGNVNSWETQTVITSQHTGGVPRFLAHGQRYLLRHGDKITIDPYQFTYYSAQAYVQYARNAAYAHHARQAQARSSTSGWVVAVVIFLIIAFFVASQQSSNSAAQNTTAQETLTSFCTNLTTDNAQTAYSLFSTHVQQLMSEQQFEEKVRQDGPNTCQATAVQQKNTTATGTLTYTFTGGKPEEISSVRLIKQNGGWKIDNSTP